MASCSVDGCEKKAKSKGVCDAHWWRLTKYGSPTSGPPIRQATPDRCQAPGCKSRKVYCKKFCEGHYRRFAKYGDPMGGKAGKLKPKDTCSEDGCQDVVKGRGLCNRHYQRLRIYGDTETRRRKNDGEGSILGTGYRQITCHGHPNATPRGLILEHRKVMSDMLGRPLQPGETVHHRNGNKLDNRPENLQLWVSFHHSGQSVEDLVRDAREIIDRYGSLVGEGAI